MAKRLSMFALLVVLISSCTGRTVLPIVNLPSTPSADPASATPVWSTLSPTPEAPVVPEAPAATLTQAPTASSTSIPVQTATPAVYGPAGFPSNVDPLTGKEISDPQLLERRPVAVKIQMFPRGGRPPWGVSLADVVYDYYQNFGMTRFHAIFYGQNAETVGPIRSARLLDIDLVNMYKTIFAYGSAEARTRTALFGQEFAPRLILEGAAPCPPMCREDPNGYNYLVANTQELSDYAIQQGVDNGRQNLDGARFDPSLPPGGNAGSQLYLRWSISAYAHWDYDPNSGHYLRFQDTQEAADLASEAYEPLMDRLTNTQIAADNVIVIVVGHRFTFGTKAGPSEVVEIGLQGTGPAYAFRDGAVFQLTWNRPNKDSVLYLTFPDGTVYPYKPGNTWYEVVGKTTKISPEGEVWHFQHFIP